MASYLTAKISDDMHPEGVRIKVVKKVVKWPAVTGVYVSGMLFPDRYGYGMPCHILPEAIAR